MDLGGEEEGRIIPKKVTIAISSKLDTVMKIASIVIHSIEVNYGKHHKHGSAGRGPLKFRHLELI